MQADMLLKVITQLTKDAEAEPNNHLPTRWRSSPSATSGTTSASRALWTEVFISGNELSDSTTHYFGAISHPNLRS